MSWSNKNVFNAALLARDGWSQKDVEGMIVGYQERLSMFTGLVHELRAQFNNATIRILQGKLIGETTARAFENDMLTFASRCALMTLEYSSMVGFLFAYTDFSPPAPNDPPTTPGASDVLKA